MVKQEISKLLAVLAAAYPRFEVNDYKLQLWFEMLNDIPYAVAQVAIKKLICESNFPPTIAEIRLVTAGILKNDEDIDAGTAWGEVTKCIRNFGIYRPEEALSTMSSKTKEVVKNIGWQDICMCENLSVVRGQFIKMYNCIKDRSKDESMLPEGLKEQLDSLISNNLIKK